MQSSEIIQQLNEDIARISNIQNLLGQIKTLEEKLSYYRNLAEEGLNSLFTNTNTFERERLIEVFLSKLLRGHASSGTDEFGRKLLAYSSPTIAPFKNHSFEILAGRAGAFKLREIKIIGLNTETGNRTNFQILDISIMGCPQMVNYQGTYVESERASSLFFEDFLKIDWAIFGSSSGQGLQVSVRNDSIDHAQLLVMVIGDPASCDLIGRA